MKMCSVVSRLVLLVSVAVLFASLPSDAQPPPPSPSPSPSNSSSECNCSGNEHTVCGVDGKNYTTKCTAVCGGFSLQCLRPCPCGDKTPADAPVNVPMPPSPQMSPESVPNPGTDTPQMGCQSPKGTCTTRNDCCTCSDKRAKQFCYKRRCICLFSRDRTKTQLSPSPSPMTRPDDEEEENNDGPSGNYFGYYRRYKYGQNENDGPDGSDGYGRRYSNYGYGYGYGGYGYGYGGGKRHYGWGRG